MPGKLNLQDFQGLSQSDWLEHCKMRTNVKSAQLSCPSPASPRTKSNSDRGESSRKARTPFRNTMNKSFKESAAKIDMVLEPMSARSSDYSHAENDSLSCNTQQCLTEALPSPRGLSEKMASPDATQRLLEEHLALEQIEKLSKDRPSSVSQQTPSLLSKAFQRPSTAHCQLHTAIYF